MTFVKFAGIFSSDSEVRNNCLSSVSTTCTLDVEPLNDSKLINAYFETTLNKGKKTSRLFVVLTFDFFVQQDLHFVFYDLCAFALLVLPFHNFHLPLPTFIIIW